MHEHGDPALGAVLEERDDAGVVEVAVTDVIADLDAGVTGGDRAVGLDARGIRILQRHLRERDEPIGCGAQISSARSLKRRATFTASSPDLS